MPLDFDQEYLDVDFSKDPKFVFGDLGDKGRFGMSRYEDVVPVLSETEIKKAVQKIEDEDSGSEWLVTRVYDQDGEGACASNSTCQGHEVVQCEQFGPERVIHLSAISLYKRVGDGPNSGSYITDNITEITKRGILPLDTPENREMFGPTVMPNIGFRTPFPANWEQTASIFRGLEGHSIQSTNGILTALCNRHPVVVGREGHSILYLTPVFLQNGQIGVLYVNSWGQWGTAAGSMPYGFGVDSVSQINKSANWAYALRSVKSSAS